MSFDMIGFFVVAAVVLGGGDGEVMSPSIGLAEAAHKALEVRTSIRFRAEFTRAWIAREGERREKGYRAEVVVEKDESRARVFDMDSGVEAARSFGKGEVENITPVGESEPDACLFGSITLAWIGSRASESSVVWLLSKPETRLMGSVVVGGRRCHRMVRLQKVFEDSEHTQWVEQILDFDQETFLPLRWTSESREGRTWEDGRQFMTVVRKFAYAEPPIGGFETGHSNLLTVEDGGAHLVRAADGFER